MKTWARPPRQCGVGHPLLDEPGNGNGAGAGVRRGQGYGIADPAVFELERTGDGWGDGRGHLSAGSHRPGSSSSAITSLTWPWRCWYEDVG